MSPERWKQVEATLDAVLDAEPAARPAVLARLCEGDPALYDEVSSLLAAHAAADTYLETPAREFAAPLLPTASVPEPSTRTNLDATVLMSGTLAPPKEQTPPATPRRSTGTYVRVGAVVLGLLGCLLLAWWVAGTLRPQPAHPYPVTLLDHLEPVFDGRVSGRLPARALLERGRRIEATLAADDPARAMVRSALGRTALQLGRYDEARQWLEGALEDGRLQDDESLDVAAGLNSLGRLYHEQGRLDEAEQHYRQALTLRRRLLPDGHVDIAASLNSLGVLLRDRGERNAATRLLEEALALRRDHYGEDHPYVASTLNNLAVLLQDQGRLAEAEQHYEEALRIQDETLGARHPRTVAMRANHATLLYTLGQTEDADRVQARVIAQHRQLYGEDHPRLAAALFNQAAQLYDQGAYEQAEPLYREAWTIYRATLPEAHPDRARLLAGYGACLTAMQRFREAEDLLTPAFETIRTERGPQDRYTQAVGRTLVALYDQWNRPGNAERYRALLASRS